MNFTIKIYFLIAPGGQSLALYFPAICNPPYGNLDKGHLSAPQQAGSL